MGNVSTGMFVLAAAGAALVATAVIHLLLLTTPRPQLFFGWIIALGTLVAVVFPLRHGPAGAEDRHRALNLILGVAIGTLINGPSPDAPGRRAGGPAPATSRVRRPIHRLHEPQATSTADRLRSGSWPRGPQIHRNDMKPQVQVLTK